MRNVETGRFATSSNSATASDTGNGICHSVRQSTIVSGATVISRTVVQNRGRSDPLVWVTGVLDTTAGDYHRLATTRGSMRNVLASSRLAPGLRAIHDASRV